MNKYYIPEISINNISHTIIDKLKNKFHYNILEDNIILSDQGYYKIINNEIFPYSFNFYNNATIINDFLIFL